MKKFRKPVKKVVTDLKCQVPKCKQPSFSGWQPAGRPDKNLRICSDHYHRDKDPEDSFSLWDVVKLPKPVNSQYRRPKTTAKKKTGRKGGFKAALYKLLDEKGANKVTFREAEKLALSLNPDSKLNKGHFRWYVKGYKATKK